MADGRLGGVGYRLALAIVGMFLAVALGSCARSGSAALINSVSGKGLHGNFCGPNHPRISETDPNVVLAKLREIDATDEMDAYCKRHDMCYAASSGDRTDCDLVLLRAIRKAQWSEGCKSRARLIDSAFSDVHPQLDLEEGKTIGIGDRTLIGRGLGRAINVAFNTASFPLGSGQGPEPYELCNSLAIPSDRNAVGLSGYPRQLYSFRNSNFELTFSPSQLGYKADRGSWSCTEIPRVFPKNYDVQPLCVSTRAPIEVRVWSRGMLDDYWKPWTLPLQKLVERTSEFLESIQKTRISVESFETVNLNGTTAIRVVYSYDSPQGRRVAVMVAYAVHGSWNMVNVSFPAADRQTLLGVAHAVVANVRPS